MEHDENYEKNERSVPVYEKLSGSKFPKVIKMK